MAAPTTEHKPRRIAVILGAEGSSGSLLHLALPLLGKGRDIEMQGVFLEEAEVQHAAELPFVKELCRVTFSVREFTSDQFEHALTLRMRTAQRALTVLARNAGVVHSFRNVRGSAVKLLRETAEKSDITLFQPARLMAATLPREVKGARPRIVVVIDEPEAGARALLAAVHLAEGRMDLMTVLLSPAAAGNREAIDRLFREIPPVRPVRVSKIRGEGIQGVVDAANAEGATMLVMGTTPELLDPAALQILREKLRCPICLVRSWTASGTAPDGADS